MPVFTRCLKFAASNKIITNQIRLYSRWSNRRPVRVLEPSEFEDLEKAHQNKIGGPSTQHQDFQKQKIKWKQPQFTQGKSSSISPDKSDDGSSYVEYKIRPKNVRLQQKKAEPTDLLHTVIDADGNLVYTKMGNKDVRISSIMMDIKSHKKQELFLLEGKRLIRDALMSGCILKHILFSHKDEIEYLKPYLPNTGAELYKMPYKEMQAWSELTTSPGIMGIFKIPNLKEFVPKNNALPMTVICDNVREPGNLGAILRACAGVGCQNVVLTKGCVNIWDTKVLRSASGSHFKLKIESKPDWRDIQCSTVEHSKVFIADSNIVSTAANTSEDSAQTSMALPEILTCIPILNYSDIDYNFCKHITLIIGGETEGISEEAYRFAIDFNGARVNVPLENNIDSLNAGTAFGIIAFEIKRQLAQK